MRHPVETADVHVHNGCHQELRGGNVGVANTKRQDEILNCSDL